MKIWTSEYIFDHSWETVSLAAWRKYPNPHKPEVMGSDIMERTVEGGVLHSQRLIASRFGLPSWSRKLLGSDDICYGYEKSQVDPKNRVMTTQSRNVTFSRTVTMGERITYRAAAPGPDGSPRTMLVQESTVQVHGIPLAGYLENTILSSITRNTYKGREAMEWVINKIQTEGNEVDFSIVDSNNNSNMGGSITKSVVDVMSIQAKISVDQFSEKALKSVDEISEKALKSVDEISEKALKSVDEISEKALKSVDEIGKAFKSVDEISEKAMLSVSEISEKASSSVDEISEKAKKSLKSVDELSGKAWRAYRYERVFNDMFNISL